MGSKEKFQDSCSKSSRDPRAHLCLLTESQLGLAWVQWGCGDLSQLLPQPASLEHALCEPLSCKQVMFAKLVTRLLLSACCYPFLMSWGMEAHVCVCVCVHKFSPPSSQPFTAQRPQCPCIHQREVGTFIGAGGHPDNENPALKGNQNRAWCCKGNLGW